MNLNEAANEAAKDTLAFAFNWLISTLLVGGSVVAVCFVIMWTNNVHPSMSMEVNLGWQGYIAIGWIIGIMSMKWAFMSTFKMERRKK